MAPGMALGSREGAAGPATASCELQQSEPMMLRQGPQECCQSAWALNAFTPLPGRIYPGTLDLQQAHGHTGEALISDSTDQQGRKN